MAASVPAARPTPPGAPPSSIRLRAWAPAVAWAMLIFFLSTDELSADRTRNWIEPVVRLVVPSLSAPAFEIVHTLLRKLAHVSEYAVFAVLLDRALRLDSPLPEAHAPLVGWAIALVYSLTDEGHQWLVASRGPSAVDCLLDGLGAALGSRAALRRRGR